MRILSLLLLLFLAPISHAQNRGRPTWLNLSYTYSDIYYQESLMNERGRFAGVRGEFGITLSPNLAVSFAGQYLDGHMLYDGATFDGTPVKTTTKDYVRDTRFLGHLFFEGFSIASGMAQRFWADDLVISYRRRTTYNYIPLVITYNVGQVYVRAEHDIWQSGKNKSHMSDTSASRRDVEFKQNSGSGIGFEVGYILPSPQGLLTQIYISYHKWSVKESDVQNDNVDNLVEPDNSTTTIQAGIGLTF